MGNSTFVQALFHSRVRNTPPKLLASIGDYDLALKKHKARQNSNSAALPRFISSVSTSLAKVGKIGGLSPKRPIISTENDTPSHHTTSIADAYRNCTNFSKSEIVYIWEKPKCRNFSILYETGCFFLDLRAFLQGFRKVLPID